MIPNQIFSGSKALPSTYVLPVTPLLVAAAISWLPPPLALLLPFFHFPSLSRGKEARECRSRGGRAGRISTYAADGVVAAGIGYARPAMGVVGQPLLLPHWLGGEMAKERGMEIRPKVRPMRWPMGVEWLARVCVTKSSGCRVSVAWVGQEEAQGKNILWVLYGWVLYLVFFGFSNFSLIDSN